MYLCTVISLTSTIKVNGTLFLNIFLCLPVNNYMFQRIYTHNLHSFVLFCYLFFLSWVVFRVNGWVDDCNNVFRELKIVITIIQSSIKSEHFGQIWRCQAPIPSPTFEFSQSIEGKYNVEGNWPNRNKKHLGGAGMVQWLSTRLPPMWPGFDSRTRRHMWVEFVVGSRLCSKRFFFGYSGFPLSSKTNISKFQFDLESVPN